MWRESAAELVRNEMKKIFKTTGVLAGANFFVQLAQFLVIVLTLIIASEDVLGKWGAIFSVLMIANVIVGGRIEIAVPKLLSFAQEDGLLRKSKMRSLKHYLLLSPAVLIYCLSVLDYEITSALFVVFIILFASFASKQLNYSTGVAFRQRETKSIVIAKLLQVIVYLFSLVPLYFVKNELVLLLGYSTGLGLAAFYLRCSTVGVVFVSTIDKNEKMDDEASGAGTSLLMRTTGRDTINAAANAVSSRLLILILPVLAGAEFAGIYFFVYRLVFFIVPLANNIFGYLVRDFAESDNEASNYKLRRILTVAVSLQGLVLVGLLHIFGDYLYRDGIIINDASVMLLWCWASLSVYGTMCANSQISRNISHPFFVLNTSLLVTRLVAFVVLIPVVEYLSDWFVVNVYTLGSAIHWLFYIIYTAIRIEPDSKAAFSDISAILVTLGIGLFILCF